jgi:anti-sigma factor RsiW
MTSHARFLELAAAAIDFGLSPVERSVLEAHLTTCHACARSAAAIRGDAVALEHLPPVVLPERRASEILAAALHPAAVVHPVRLLVLAALLGLLLVGSLGVAAQLLRSDDDLSVVPPMPTATPGPDATPGPEDLAKLAWTRQGDAPGSAPDIIGVTGDIVGFAGGYVARHQGPGVYFSPDGRAWQSILLPPLDIEGAEEPWVAALASNGAQMLAVGGYGHDPCRSTDTGEGPACEMSPMAWVTDDGVTWRPSDPWALPPGVAEPEWGADASAAWAVPGGWEAARVSWEGASSSPLDVWRSADGITWERVAALESPAYNRGHGVAVADDGTRVRWDSLLISPSETRTEAQALLRVSADGATWTELGTFPGADVRITRVAPPIPGRRSTWVVAGTEIHFDEGGGIGTAIPRIWTSSDLSTWTAADLEVPAGAPSGIYGLTWSGDELVAVDAQGLTWASTNGSTWILLADRRAVGLIADGPVGIIGMPEPGWDGDEGIWLLRAPPSPSQAMTAAPHLAAHPRWPW